ncbi:hypothetical protein NDU88_002460 [Pleurodeles waltl]|uniref:Uncharacterized protein n=1 Tax=Pleurodeles waltl TaxID=8319 RepID=A0AAV7MNX2_PLEWA|nr:hypothetical protein NDU88_002460 [Pleurodeles waltl]
MRPELPAATRTRSQSIREGEGEEPRPETAAVQAPAGDSRALIFSPLARGAAAAPLSSEHTTEPARAGVLRRQASQRASACREPEAAKPGPRSTVGVSGGVIPGVRSFTATRRMYNVGWIARPRQSLTE